ncbi:MAG: MotB family protein [Pseudomonadota bacterium]
MNYFELQPSQPEPICECDDPPAEKKMPAWVVTFADLMSLLMCFFVLILSFSDPDPKQYKEIAGSMADAFGVQLEVPVKAIPKGTSFIQQEFSSGRPDQQAENEMQQKTSDVAQKQLDMQDGTNKIIEAKKDALLLVELLKAKELIKKVANQEKEIIQQLEQEIHNGAVEVGRDGLKIIIRLKNKNSFVSGSAIILPNFIPVISQVRQVLANYDANFSIAGHTDDTPIETPQFRSNWDLSAARAVSVTQELLKYNHLEPRRFLVIGHADTKPLILQKTEAAREKNRRVEIIIEPNDEGVPITAVDRALKILKKDVTKKNGERKGEFSYDFGKFIAQ